jgi:drug/metabolite transporter (DMT)-like permease
MGTGILCGLAAGFFWGFSFLVPKLLVDFSPAQVAFGRFSWFAFASLVSVALNPTRFVVLCRKETLRKALFFSLAGYSVYYFLLVTAIRMSGIPMVSLLIGLLPLTVALASRSRPERTRLFQASLLLIGFGIGLINLDAFSWQGSGSENGVFVWGMVLSVVALASWTWFAIANAGFLQSHPDTDNVAWTGLLAAFSFLGVAVLSLGEVAFTGHFGLGASVPLSAVKWWEFLFWTGVLGLGSTYFASWLWNKASVTLPSSLSGQLIVSETFFALLFSFLYENRFPSFLESASIGFLITGVFLGIYSFRK